MERMTKKRILMIMFLFICIFALAHFLGNTPKVKANHEMSGTHILNDNTSFESGGTNATSWSIWKATPVIGTVERVEGVARTGNASLLIDHLVNRGGPHETIAAYVGKMEAQLYLSTPPGTVTAGTVEIKFRLRDVNKKELLYTASGELPIPATSGTWIPIQHSATIPAEVDGVAVHDVFVIATFSNVGDAKIYLDDFVIAKEINPNSSFELGGTNNASDWSIWKTESTSGTIRRVTGVSNTGIRVSRTGNASLLIDNLSLRGGPYQDINVNESLQDGHEGPVVAELFLSTLGADTNGTIELKLYTIDVDAERKDLFTSTAKPIATSVGWNRIQISAMIPEKVDGVVVDKVRVMPIFTNAGDADIYIDDFTVTKKLDDSLVIVKDNQANAVIILADNAAAEVTEAANNLAYYVKQSTGAVIPVYNTPSAFANVEANYAGHTRIYVGHAAPGDQAEINAGLSGLDEEGFMIHPQGLDVTIMGPSIQGTSNGVYDFIERNIGVRWLMPGPKGEDGGEGEDVPLLTDIWVSRMDIIDEPSANFRFISAAIGSDLWSKANKIQKGEDPIKFEHNLFDLFDPKKFPNNPEYYPNGVPKVGERRSWNPCFSTATKDAAVAELIKYFNDYPNETSYSLGINDSKTYCKTNEGYGVYPTEKNSVGDLHMSEIYYAWVNDVVEEVLVVHPDKWFGLLGYYNVSDAPSFALNSRVIPYIAKDRMAWTDDAIQAIGRNQMAEWKTKANEIGWYDYLYGVHYAVPRIYPQLIAENIKYAAQNDVYGHYIEMYHNVGDGPKAWITAKLLWDPDLDVDALLNEWYVRTVGPDAAADLAALYDLWENFWTERIKASPWFQADKQKTFLGFGSQDYLHLVTDEDIEDSMSLIASVVAKATPGVQKARAEKIHKMFKYYEASVLSFPRKVESIPDEAAALEVLDIIDTGFREQLKDDRLSLKESFESDPILKFNSSRWYEWSVYNGSEFWSLAEYIQNFEANGGPVTNKVELLANNAGSNAQEYANLLQEALSGQASLTLNSSFEEGAEKATSWSDWIASGSGTIRRVVPEDNARLKINGMSRGGPHQTFDVHAGLLAAEVKYYTSGTTTDGKALDGTVELVVHLKNEGGTTLESFRSKVELSLNTGGWNSLAILENVPASVKLDSGIWDTVAKAQMLIVIDGAVSANVYLDDAVAYQLNLNLNHSFEEGVGISATSWNEWVTPGGSGEVDRVGTDTPGTEVRTGDASLLVDNMSRGGPTQKLYNVQTGMAGAQVHFFTDGTTTSGTTTDGTIELILHLKNASDSKLTSFRSPKVNLSANAGKWNTLGVLATIPETVGDDPVAYIQLVILIDGAQNTEVYLDDAVVYQVYN